MTDWSLANRIGVAPGPMSSEVAAQIEQGQPDRSSK